jgi:hypothetical protein
LVKVPRNGERERRPTGGRGWNRLRAGLRLQAAQTAGFTQKDGKANTVKHDVTEGVTNAVTESVRANSRGDRGSPGNSRCYRGCYRHCYTQLAVGDGTAYARGHRLQAAQTDGFIQKNGKAITVKHDVTAGVTNAVTESVTATPAVSADHWVTAGVT